MGDAGVGVRAAVGHERLLDCRLQAEGRKAPPPRRPPRTPAPHLTTSYTPSPSSPALPRTAHVATRRGVRPKNPLKTRGGRNNPLPTDSWQ